MGKNALKELRRHACAGREKQVHSLLLGMLEEEPNDCFALAELQRLKAGKQLYSTLDFKDYRRIVDEAAVESLHQLMLHNPISSVGHLSNEQIRKILASFHFLEERTLEKSVQDAELRKYRIALKRVLGKRSFRAGSKVAIGAGVVLIVLLMLTGGGLHLRSQAKAAGETVEKAVAAEDWQRVLSLRESANSGINKMIYPPMEGIINRVDAWVAHKRTIHREASTLLEELHAGKYSIENMPLTKRALMERYLRALPAGLNDISPAWEKLCEQARAELERQIPQAIAEISKPLPEFPQWKGNGDDPRNAEIYRREIQKRLKENTDEVDAYRLDAKLLAPIQQRMAQATECEKEIKAWNKAIRNIGEAKSYAQFTAALQKLGTPTIYPPALSLFQLTKSLPKEENVLAAMQDPEGKVPQTLRKVMQATLLEGGATFCKEGPATSAQVELLDDIFTTRTLRTKLYRICDAYGNVAFTTKPYATEKNNYISFTRAELDPAFGIGKTGKELWRNQGITQKIVDVSGLVQASGLSRNTFFVRANLPKVLTLVLQYKHDTCPALAKAYVYDTLVHTMQLHEHPAMIGAEYSPSLQADITSFQNLRKAHNIRLRAGCWLLPPAQINAAEAAFAEWFQQNQAHDYAAEIARNYGLIAHVHPVYIGYIDANGKAVLCGNVPKGEELWHIGRDGIKHDIATLGNVQGAIPYSPLFLKVKDKKK